MSFAIYSTDIEPTTDPGGVAPAPARIAVFDQDPVFGTYDHQAGSEGRGSVHQTMGGVVVQDFGVFDGDARIRIAEDNALSSAIVSELKSLHDTTDGEYYFTDGVDIWKVKFQRPEGLKTWRNLLFSARGAVVYSYEINLIVTEKVESEYELADATCYFACEEAGA